MKSGKTLKSSTFATARLAAMLAAAVILFADAASAGPRPGNPGNNMPSRKPENNILRSGIQVGPGISNTNPRMSPAALKVPCAVCTYKPPMLTQAGTRR